MGIRVQAYHPMFKEQWNAFITRSSNATFLFNRDYMDYHQDRFTDCSVMVFDDKSRIVALFPANVAGLIITSHAGLTYGGFVVADDMTLTSLEPIFDAVVSYFSTQGFTTLIYKTIPHIYHARPFEADHYCLFIRGATLFRRDVLTVIDYQYRLVPQSRRLRSVKKAVLAGLTVKETDDYGSFWQILEYNLITKYNVRPVHSLEEIQLLRQRFPEEIKLYAAYDGEQMRAGVLVYLSRNVCHMQYSGTSEEGKQSGALDLVLSRLIEGIGATRRFFDFGASTEWDGRHLNIGLVEFKEGFGGRTIVHDFYRIDLVATKES